MTIVRRKAGRSEDAQLHDGHGAEGDHYRIHSSRVIAAAFRERKGEDRQNERNAECAVPHAAPRRDDTCNRERESEGIRANKRLKEPEIARAAAADAEIARMNVFEKVERDEVVVYLPDQVR